MKKSIFKIWWNIAITLSIAIFIGLIFLNPLWKVYSPPFPILKVLPAITAPVDGPFYLQNAKSGYDWTTREPLSLWYHPLLSWLVGLMPTWISNNYWFWFISLLFGAGALYLTWELATWYFKRLSPNSIPIILLAPAGLSFATGNPEIPCLFFNLGLLLSVIKWKKWWSAIIFGLLAILTKPNSLYMVPILFVYFIFGIRRKEKYLWFLSVVGIIVIALGWLSWMIYTDMQTKVWGSYWSTRILFDKYVAGDPISFFRELANSFLTTQNLRDQIRYSSAIIIPLVNFWLIGFVDIADNADRFALASGNLAMIVIALFQGNPNKIIVYANTLPGFFAIFLILFQNFLDKEWRQKKINKSIMAIMSSYCLLMLIIYVLGTPLGWYY